MNDDMKVLFTFGGNIYKKELEKNNTPEKLQNLIRLKVENIKLSIEDLFRREGLLP